MRTSYFICCSSTLNISGDTYCSVKVTHIYLYALNLNFIYAKFLLHHFLSRERPSFHYTHMCVRVSLYHWRAMKEASVFTDALSAACFYFISVSWTCEVKFVTPTWAVVLWDLPKVHVRTSSVKCFRCNCTLYSIHCFSSFKINW